MSTSKNWSSQVFRISVSLIAIASCLFIVVTSAKVGFSRLLSKFAQATNSIPAANEAVKLTPSDPTAHRARAAVLNNLRLHQDAREALEAAVSLRYRDDYLWLELGNTREELDDREAALAAFDQAVRWAPHYAHTHWQRGNLKLRLGRYDEALPELRQAAASNRNFMPNLIDLAWGLSGGDPKVAEQLVQVNDDQTRLAFVRLLARNGKGKETVEQYRLIRASISPQHNADLVRQLIESKSYRPAFELWSMSHSNSESPMSIYDGGFEGPLAFDEEGFGWRVSRERAKTTIALDVSERQAGKKSLQIAFDGNANPGESMLSQTIIVKPGQRYRVSFGVSTRNVVSGGLPVITAADAGSEQLLGKSDSLPEGSSPWRSMSFDFTTLATSEAVILSLKRNNCNSEPCPIFGALWLDSFSIEELPAVGPKP